MLKDFVLVTDYEVDHSIEIVYRSVHHSKKKKKKKNTAQNIHIGLHPPHLPHTGWMNMEHFIQKWYYLSEPEYMRVIFSRPPIYNCLWMVSNNTDLHRQGIEYVK